MYLMYYKNGNKPNSFDSFPIICIPVAKLVLFLARSNPRLVYPYKCNVYYSTPAQKDVVRVWVYK